MKGIRSHILTALVTAMLMTVLFAGVGKDAPVLTPRVRAQATTTKPDLISNYRQNARDFVNWKNSNKALRAQFDALGFSWADGDFTGANAGITASQFTTSVTNLSNLVTAFESGATISAGYPATIYVVQ